MSDDTSDDSGDRTRRNGDAESGPRDDATDWFGDADGRPGHDAADDPGEGSGVDPDDEESPFGEGVPQIPGVDIDDASVDAGELAAQAGLGAGDEDGDTAGGATRGITGDGTAGDPAAGNGTTGAGATVGKGGARSAGAVSGTAAEDQTRVLEFALGEERYCLDIEHVEEIVKRETVTRVPNTPDYVAGVVDLRGQITTILDPKVLFDIDVEGSEDLIVVFDPDGFGDQGAIGWLVDDVNQVMPVADSEVNPSPVEQDHIEGVVDRDGEFVIWTAPELAIEDATG